MACAVTQVIISLDIQEGKEAMVTTKYMQEWAQLKQLNCGIESSMQMLYLQV